MNKCSRLIVVAALVTLTARAVDWKAFRPEGSTNDFARVIDSGSRQQLEKYCQEVERATGAKIALVIIPSLEGEPIEDVAHTFFQAWNLSNQGVLLLVAIGERRSEMEVGPGLREALPAGMKERVLEEMGPAVRRRHYGEAMMAAAATIGEGIARAKRVRLSANLDRHIRRTGWDRIPWVMLPGALVLLIWLLLSGGTRGYGGRRPGFLARVSSLTSRANWGGRGNGGFGGYDSGDSFGGFGGGASSDW